MITRLPSSAHKFSLRFRLKPLINKLVSLNCIWHEERGCFNIETVTKVSLHGVQGNTTS